MEGEKDEKNAQHNTSTVNNCYRIHNPPPPPENNKKICNS